MKRALALLSATALFGLSGCAEPFRIHADPSSLKGSVSWHVSEYPLEAHGFFGPNSQSTEYQHSSSSPPFQAYVLVISERQAGGYTPEELKAQAVDLLRAAAQNNLTLDPAKQQEGDRTLQNGLATHWITQEGRVTSPGLFAPDATVRLVAETGFDGLSGTAFVAIGRIQVAAARTCPILVQCTPTVDYRSWNAVVADPVGSITVGNEREGPKAPTGLLYDLVTHD